MKVRTKLTDRKGARMLRAPPCPCGRSSKDLRTNAAAGRIVHDEKPEPLRLQFSVGKI
jgi:hypothetical protein